MLSEQITQHSYNHLWTLIKKKKLTAVHNSLQLKKKKKKSDILTEFIPWISMDSETS